MHTNKHLLTVVLIIIFFGFGFLFGSHYGKKAASPVMREAMENKEDSFEAGWKAAKEKVQESKVVVSTTEVHSIPGIVDSTSRTSFRFTSSYKSRNPLAEPAPEKRIANVTDETQFIVRKVLIADEMRTAQEKYAQDLKAYREAITSGEIGLTPPRPIQRYVDRQGSYNDVNTGDEVHVYNNDINIEYEEEFNAQSVYIFK